jgi:hypothetical protein
VQRLISFPEIREAIISTAEPSVNLRKRIEMLGAIFVQHAKPNRGLQLNQGAQSRHGRLVTVSPRRHRTSSEHIRALAELEQMYVIGGAFHRHFDDPLFHFNPSSSLFAKERASKRRFMR